MIKEHQGAPRVTPKINSSFSLFDSKKRKPTFTLSSNYLSKIPPWTKNSPPFPTFDSSLAKQQPPFLSKTLSSFLNIANLACSPSPSEANLVSFLFAYSKMLTKERTNLSSFLPSLSPVPFLSNLFNLIFVTSYSQDLEWKSDKGSMVKANSRSGLFSVGAGNGNGSYLATSSLGPVRWATSY